MEPEHVPISEDMEFYSRPQIKRLPNGLWRARYPATDWSVTADSRESVVEKLQLEDQRRVQEQPDYIADRFRDLQRHLVEPIQGVYAVTHEQGERIRASKDPQVEWERIADDIDAQSGT